MAKAKEFMNSIEFGKVSKLEYIADDGTVQTVNIKATGLHYGKGNQDKSQWYLSGEDEKKNPILIPVFKIMEQPANED